LALSLFFFLKQCDLGSTTTQRRAQTSPTLCLGHHILAILDPVWGQKPAFCSGPQVKWDVMQGAQGIAAATKKQIQLFTFYVSSFLFFQWDLVNEICLDRA
jgi:hypothetical protein